MLQEQSIGMHYNDGVELIDYVKNKDDFAIEDGSIRPLSKPGLGVEIDKEFVIKQSKIEHDWKSPHWRHDDGSVAEW